MRARAVVLGLLILAGGGGVWLWMRPQAVRSGELPPEPPLAFAPNQIELHRTVPDDRAGFTLLAGRPWKLQYGRGSGMDGLETWKVDETGAFEVIRQRYFKETMPGTGVVWSFRWERAQAKLSDADLDYLVTTLNRYKPTTLHKAYHANVQDGAQWVFWLRQGKHEKSIYMDNHFPEPLLRIAGLLDLLQARYMPPDGKWVAVPKAEFGKHDKELWSSLGH